jgi:excisionase family DNA binding protein
VFAWQLLSAAQTYGGELKIYKNTYSEGGWRGSRRPLENNTMTDAITIEPVTVTVPVALRICGLGRTKFYELLADGEIASVRVGTRRLIVFASLKARLTGAAA